MNPLNKMYQKIKNLPNKKNYLEFVTALLSIPVLLTVVYMNYLSIQEKRKTDTVSPSPAPTQSVITIIREREEEKSPSSTVSTEKNTECESGLGKIEIANPDEGSTISDNPLEIDINYTKGKYCSAVWSYRLNEGNWSDYTDNNIEIYNLPSGEKKLELRVKNIVSGETETVERNFTYKNTTEIPTPTSIPATSTPSPTSTPSVQGVTDQTTSP